MDDKTQAVLDQDAALNKRIIALPEDKVFTKRAVVTIASPVIVLLLTLVFNVRSIASETKSAINQRNEVLAHENEKLELEIIEQEDLLRQAVDAVVLLQGVLRENGINPPEIVIRPTTTVPDEKN